MTEDKLYEMSMQCVKLSAEGCSCECNLCEFNISAHISDTKKAALLKSAAYTDYISRKGTKNKPQELPEIPKIAKKITAFFVILALIFLVLIIVM